MIKGSAILFRAQEEQLKEDCYHKELSAIGILASSLQVLAFNFINSDQLNDALNRPNDFRGIIFTSPRAVEAIAKCTADAWRGNLQHQWVNHDHFAVGEATASLAVSLLGLSCQGQDSGNSKMLAALIIKDAEQNSKPFLFPCSTISKETLPAIFANAGHTNVELIDAAIRQHLEVQWDSVFHIPLQSLRVYETVAHPLLQQNLDRCIAEKGFPEYIVFFSPSGIRHALPHLRTLNAPLGSIKFVAIGPTTAEALRATGLNVHSVATDPNAQALAAAVGAFRK